MVYYIERSRNKGLKTLIGKIEDSLAMVAHYALSNVSFPTKEDCLQLQSADLLAWSFHRFDDSRRKSNPQIDPSLGLTNIKEWLSWYNGHSLRARSRSFEFRVVGGIKADICGWASYAIAMGHGSRKQYPSDVSVAQFDRVRPLLEGVRKVTKPRRVDLHEVFNAVLYVLKSGCQWRMLPEGFPKWRTVHSYFAKWSEPGPDGISVLERALKQSGWRGPRQTGTHHHDQLLDR